MGTVGVLIIFSIIAGIICGRAGSAGGAILFLSLALALFVNTPAGSGLPGAVSDFVATVNESTSPALNGGNDQDEEE